MKNIFLYSVLLVVAVFLITRLPYYIYYPFTVLSSDSGSYCAVAFDILNSRLPIFDIRTPGYPFFLSLIWFFSKNLFYVSLVQSLLTLFTSIVFLIVIYKTYEHLIFFFAISLSAFISSSFYLTLETALLTEGIFVNFLILCSALLILALKKNKIRSWIFFSISLAMTILIRPAGLFLCVIIILLIIFFKINKYKLKFYASLVGPFLIIILSLCSYNYFTLKNFTITPFGENNLAGVTILFMEPSPEYTESVNDAIKSTLDKISSKDISYVKNSFGMTKLYDIFLNNFHKELYLVDNLMKYDSASKYMDFQPILRKISFDAIKKYPEVYMKFFLSNFYKFFMNIRESMKFYVELSRFYESAILNKKYYKEIEEGRWMQLSSNSLHNQEVKSFYLEEIDRQSSPEYVIKSGENKIEFKQTVLKSIYEIYENAYNFLFRNIIWLILFLLTFFISMYRLIRSRFSDVDAFIIFLFGIMFISKAILVSSVEASLVRYSYTIEFVLYFSLPFSILLLKNNFKKSLPADK